MKIKLLAAALLLGTANFAAAADAIVEEVVVMDSAYNWSGVYVGAQLGYGFSGDADYVYDNGSDSDFDYANDLDGIFGGVYAGYNYQFSNGIVLGAEADVAWGDVSGSAIAGDDDYSNETSFDWTGSARVRLGYAMDRFLPYVTGGVAFGQLDFEEFNEGDFYSGEDASVVGWTVGAGAEYAVTDNWVLRGEYRYTQFDDKDFTTQPEDEDYSVDADIHDIRIGLAYKF